MGVSKDEYIAQQKASEAVESIYTARNTGQKSWNTICNIGSADLSCRYFYRAATQLCDPGADGIVGTADDNCAILDSIVTSGSGREARYGETTCSSALTNFNRTITITSIPGNAELRQITVTINYTSGRFNRTYTLTTNISAFS